MNFSTTMFQVLNVFICLALITANSVPEQQPEPQLEPKVGITPEEEIKEGFYPTCLSFTTQFRKACVPLQQFRDEKGYKFIEPETIGWSNVVFYMIIHNDPSVDVLINAHFTTWLKHIGDADLVFVTDLDDPRTLEQIVPDSSDEVDAKLHLYKSPAVNEGKHIRFKVMDAIRHVTETYANDDTKKYFFKMDADTYVLGPNLLEYVQKLHNEAYGLPIHFGKLMCGHRHMCHSGGAFYGMNKVGLAATNKFFKENPEIYKKEEIVYREHLGRSFNLMAHEDFMVSYAFKMANKVPAIMQMEIFQSALHIEGIGTIEDPPITYHLLKTPIVYLTHEAFFYNGHGELRKRAALERLFPTRQAEIEWVRPYGFIKAGQKQE